MDLGSIFDTLPAYIGTREKREPYFSDARFIMLVINAIGKVFTKF
jgi:hypothetical protein